MKNIKIDILGMSYSVRVKGGEDKKHARELAQYVESKIKKQAPSGSQILSSRYAVKAALDIADELHRLKQEMELSSRRIRERQKKLIKLLEQGLR